MPSTTYTETFSVEHPFDSFTFDVTLEIEYSVEMTTQALDDPAVPDIQIDHTNIVIRSDETPTHQAILHMLMATYGSEWAHDAARTHVETLVAEASA